MKEFNYEIDEACEDIFLNNEGLCWALFKRDHINGICQMITGRPYHDDKIPAYYLGSYFSFGDNRKNIRLTLLELYRNYYISEVMK